VGDRIIRLIYGERANERASLATLASRKALSLWYGAYCRSGHSRQLIAPFIAENNIDMTGCSGSYKNFAEFFARQKRGIVFPEEATQLGAPCEGLASAYTDIDPDTMVAAKGSLYSLAELFGDAALAEQYRGGSCLRVRLTPANYHRMHFFDDGEVTDATYIDGDLYSVNPLAVEKIARLYCRNKRVRVQVATQQFGNVVIMEVGATFVGSIVHKFLVGDKARRGRQASYFLPGGSLVLVYFQPGAVTLDADMLARTAQHIETRVNVGTVVGRRP